MSGALKARQDSDRLRPWGPRCQKAEVSESREDEAGSELGSGTGAVWSPEGREARKVTLLPCNTAYCAVWQ